jgi:hypothetical protein
LEEIDFVEENRAIWRGGARAPKEGDTVTCESRTRDAGTYLRIHSTSRNDIAIL